MTLVRLGPTAPPPPTDTCRHPSRQRAGGVVLLALALVLALALSVAGPAGATDRALSWASLTASQQQALAPLKSYWSTIDTSGRRKWLEVAARYPAMPADEQVRAQQYMASWAALTPADRTRARLQFQEAQRLSPEERQARWEAYRALSDEERQRLSQAAPTGVRRPAAANGAASAAAAATSKSNVVTVTVSPRPRPVTPTVVQARPGVSTTSIAAPANPPAHHQTGLPKIVATPGFVDPATLLPKRGPQGAAARPAAPDDASLQQ